MHRPSRIRAPTPRLWDGARFSFFTVASDNTEARPLFGGVYYPRRNTFRVLSGSVGEATEHEPRCSHILLSKGIPMLDIIGTIVDAVASFFTTAINTVAGSIGRGEA